MLFVLALTSAILVSSIGSPIISSAGIKPESALSWTLGDALQFVGFGIAGIGYILVTDRADLVSIRWPTYADFKWLVVGLVGLLGSYAIVTTIFGLLGVSGAESVIVERGKNQPIYFLYLIPVTILLVGPTEELIFRGLIQGVLDEAYGPKIAILIASVIFTVPHYPSYIGKDLITILPTLSVVLILGGILGVLYEKSQNLVVPSVIHGLFNTFQFAAAYASIVGLVGG